MELTSGWYTLVKIRSLGCVSFWTYSAYKHLFLFNMLINNKDGLLLLFESVDIVGVIYTFYVRIRQFEGAVQQAYSVTFIIIGFENGKAIRHAYRTNEHDWFLLETLIREIDHKDFVKFLQTKKEYRLSHSSTNSGVHTSCMGL